MVAFFIYLCKMQKTDLLKKLLPGFLPIIVYIIADEFFGTRIGIAVAVVVGIAELIYFYIKEHRIEKFVIADTLLLIALSGISILLDNDIFFKLKPAFIELIIVVILGISAFSSKNLMLKMSQHYMRGIEINELARKKMKQNSQVLFFIFLFHSILIIYSAYFMSDKAWAFISTVLFYIIIGAYFLFEIVKNKYLTKHQ